MHSGELLTADVGFCSMERLVRLDNAEDLALCPGWEILVTQFPWLTPYKEAFSVKWELLPDARRTAIDAIITRLRAINVPETVEETREQCALLLALSDLSVLWTSYLHRHNDDPSVFATTGKVDSKRIAVPGRNGHPTTPASSQKSA